MSPDSMEATRQSSPIDSTYFTLIVYVTCNDNEHMRKISEISVFQQPSSSCANDCEKNAHLEEGTILTAKSWGNYGEFAMYNVRSLQRSAPFIVQLGSFNFLLGCGH